MIHYTTLPDGTRPGELKYSSLTDLLDSPLNLAEDMPLESVCPECNGLRVYKQLATIVSVEQRGVA
jgi:hypothetical protein